MRTRVTIGALTVLLAATARPALAVDCNVNTFEARNTAKLRGWTFSCLPSGGLLDGKADGILPGC